MKLSKGSQYMILSSLFFSLIGLGVKLLAPISNIEINFFKSLVALCISFSFLTQAKVPFWGNNRRLLLLRGASSGLGIIFFFMTLQHLPLASANLLQNTAPIFTSILGIFMLGEAVTSARWFFFAISFLGVCLAHALDFDANTVPLNKLIIGLLSAFLMGLSNNFTGKMRDTEHPWVIFNYTTIFVAVFAGIYLLFDGFTVPKPIDWSILAYMGLLSCAAHYLAIRAYQLSPVANISAISYLGIPYALLIDVFLLGEHFQRLSLVGMALVMLGVFLSLKYK